MSGKVSQRSGNKDQQTLNLANILIKESYTNLQMNVTSVTVITWVAFDENRKNLKNDPNLKFNSSN